MASSVVVLPTALADIDEATLSIAPKETPNARGDGAKACSIGSTSWLARRKADHVPLSPTI